MKKKQVKMLAEQSYKQNKLDEQTVITASHRMNRKTLKKYITALKNIEKTHNVIIALPNVKSYNTNKKAFETLFKNKNIILQEDTDLILGIKITDNDMIFEQSLTSSLEAMTTEIKQQYE